MYDTLGRLEKSGEDSYRGDGLNLYAYVGNNSINYVDLSGHKIKDIPGRIVDEAIQAHLEMGAGVSRKKVKGDVEGQIGVKLVSVNLDYGANGKGEWSYLPSFLEVGAEIKSKNENLPIQIGGKTKYVTDPHLKNGHWENEVGLVLTPIKLKAGEALSNASVSWGGEVYFGPGIGGEISVKQYKVIDIIKQEMIDSVESWINDKCK